MEYTETAAGKSPAELSGNDLEQIVGGVNPDFVQPDETEPDPSVSFQVIKKKEDVSIGPSGNRTYEVINTMGKLSKP